MTNLETKATLQSQLQFLTGADLDSGGSNSRLESVGQILTMISSGEDPMATIRNLQSDLEIARNDHAHVVQSLELQHDQAIDRNNDAIKQLQVEVKHYEFNNSQLDKDLGKRINQCNALMKDVEESAKRAQEHRVELRNLTKATDDEIFRLRNSIIDLEHGIRTKNSQQQFWFSSVKQFARQLKFRPLTFDPQSVTGVTPEEYSDEEGLKTFIVKEMNALDLALQSLHLDYRTLYNERKTKFESIRTNLEHDIKRLNSVAYRKFRESAREKVQALKTAKKAVHTPT